MSADGHRALVVDADGQTRSFCRGVLEELGFSVRDVDSGVAAVVAAREMVPDVILLGAQLRDVSGREALVWFDANPALHMTQILILNAWPPMDGDIAQKRRSTIALPDALSALALRRGVETALQRRSAAKRLEG